MDLRPYRLRWVPLKQVPEDVIWSDWVHQIVEESKKIQAMAFEHYVSQAAVRARKHSEQKPEADFREGELVLVSKPFYEKGTGVILPQCDGPYTFVRVPTAHTVLLVDTLSGEAAFEGKAVSCARLIRFKFPSDWAGPEPGGTEDRKNAFVDIKRGAFIACAPQGLQYTSVHVARVEKIYQEQQLCDVLLFHELLDIARDRRKPANGPCGILTQVKFAQESSPDLNSFVPLL